MFILFLDTWGSCFMRYKRTQKQQNYSTNLQTLSTEKAVVTLNNFTDCNQTLNTKTRKLVKRPGINFCAHTNHVTAAVERRFWLSHAPMVKHGIFFGSFLCIIFLQVALHSARLFGLDIVSIPAFTQFCFNRSIIILLSIIFVGRMFQLVAQGKNNSLCSNIDKETLFAFFLRFHCDSVAEMVAVSKIPIQQNINRDQLLVFEIGFAILYRKSGQCVSLN